jgi:hypothetical protein
VSWPTARWFPAPLEPAGRWSLSSGDDGADFRHARVRVEDPSGAALQVRRFRAEPGIIGEPTVVFHVDGLGRHGAYKVIVRGIRLPGRTAPVRHAYTVRLFQPR